MLSDTATVSSQLTGNISGKKNSLCIPSASVNNKNWRLTGLQVQHTCPRVLRLLKSVLFRLSKFE